ncbi:PA2169 family four-helix-bundle protein [Mucilaginibacter sp.]|uniref:ferritin-like domain-containing protein n=1 Tax=Mucilaginibacter sp. TaxID=1882438 RepID=UPI0025EB5FB3|nr:PA2169 family four-helix-bundle protein [Mucilaginibacter sp.]
METTEKSIDVLNDLIEINNDRVAGFEKASKDLDEGEFELKGIFDRFAAQSRTYASELSSEIGRVGGEAETGTSGTGALHRAWLDVKATFSGHDRKSILEECERGEDAIKKAYRTALDPENELAFEAADLIRRQQQGINVAHDQIKALRDVQA